MIHIVERLHSERDVPGPKLGRDIDNFLLQINSQILTFQKLVRLTLVKRLYVF